MSLSGWELAWLPPNLSFLRIGEERKAGVSVQALGRGREEEVNCERQNLIATFVGKTVTMVPHCTCLQLLPRLTELWVRGTPQVPTQRGERAAAFS